MSRCRDFRSRLHLPEDLTRDILSRLPAKSVAMFRCVSTTWLSISTDPSFILAHARRAPKIFLVNSVHYDEYGEYDGIKIQSFSLSTGGIGKRRLLQNSDEAMCSCDGLVCFRARQQLGIYIENPLSGLRIRLPNTSTISILHNSVCEFYCYRRTGEYRLLNLSHRSRSANYYLKAVVLSLGGAYSVRGIEIGVPYVSHLNQRSSVLVNDCFYWTCRRRSPKSIAILVFDTLQESFSLLQIPSNGKKTFPSFENYGLVEMEGELGYWTVELYKSRSVLVEVWTLVNSDEKWRNTHSLCLAGDAVCVMSSVRRPTCLFAGFGEGELLCLFQDEASYLLHWDVKSGNFYIEKLPITDIIAINRPARIYVYRETLINLPSPPPTMP